MSNFVPLKDLINRDINPKKKEGKYQIQSEINSKYAKIIILEKQTPDLCIYETEIDDFNCSLIQYTLSDDDIKKKNYYMMGYLIKNKKNTLIGSLNFVFVPDLTEEIKLKENQFGKFNVVLSNNKNEHKIIKTLNEYVGNNNIVYVMTELLGDCLVNIIEDN